MVSKFIPAAVVGALALATSVFATAHASVSAAPTLKPFADTSSPIIQIRNGKGAPRAFKGGGGSFKGGGIKSAPGRTGKIGSGPKGSFKGGSKGGPHFGKGGGSRGPVRWSRDRRHRFYGAFFAVPLGFALYAGNPCYDWSFGPHGWGYYWNYYRCPL